MRVDIDWFSVIAMVLIIEGMMPLLFPRAWKSYLSKVAQEPISAIRQIGGVLFAIGIIMLWLR
jgi:hypothetical protein